MLLKNLKYNLILSLLFLLVNKVVYGQNFIPEPRYGQASVLIGDRAYYIGKIYTFGGTNDGKTFYNNLDILDTINLSWGIGSLENAPLPGCGYTATLVGEIIYYIGGMQTIPTGQDNVPMENVCKLIHKF